MPHRTTLDQETKEYVSYPIFSFNNREKHKEFINIIKQKTIEYMSKKETK